MRAGTSRSLSDVQLPGVVFIDHTADVGIAVAAPSLDALFHSAALGMLALLRGEDDEPGDGHRPQDPHREHALVGLTATALPSLLADWLREILFLHEIEHRDYVDAEFEALGPDALRARVRTAPSTGAVREIKGVTYHELAVERTGSGWEAQVIFDV